MLVPPTASRRSGHNTGARAISSHRLASAAQLEPGAVHPAWKYFQGFAARRRSSLGLSAVLGGGVGSGASSNGSSAGVFGSWSNPWKQQQQGGKKPFGAGESIAEDPRIIPRVAAGVPPPNYPGGPAGSDPMDGKIYPAGLGGASGSGSSYYIPAAAGGASAVSVEIRGSSSDEDGLPRHGGDGGGNRQAEFSTPICAPPTPPPHGGDASAGGAFRAKHAGTIAAGGADAAAQQQQGRRRDSSWFNLAFGARHVAPRCCAPGPLACLPCLVRRRRRSVFW